MPSWMGMNFQDTCSPFMSQLIFFHDHVMMIMTFILIFIVYNMCFMVKSKYFYKGFSESNMIEVVWSVIPVGFLMALVLPSMKILYMMEDVKTPAFTFKVIGHQWYWSYVSPMLKNMFFNVNGVNMFFHECDSMMGENNVSPRLINCTSQLNLPVNKISRIMVSSTDVIHSFTVPSMGMKVDAVPGRINQMFATPQRCGVFVGQCSEICGSNHSFMPISIKVMDINSYDTLTTKVMLEEMKILLLS